MYDNLSKACNTHCPEENGFGDSWLGHVAIIHNIPWKSIRCKGYIRGKALEELFSQHGFNVATDVLKNYKLKIDTDGSLIFYPKEN